MTKIMDKKNLGIDVKKNFVLLYDMDNGETVYDIKRCDLPKTRDGFYSEWILHLMTKTWIDIKTLYDLAVAISILFPGNNIDWHKTFYVVEMENYLKLSGGLLSPKEGPADNDNLNRIELDQNQINKNIGEVVNKIVNQKLEKFNLNS